MRKKHRGICWAIIVAKILTHASSCCSLYEAISHGGKPATPLHIGTKVHRHARISMFYSYNGLEPL